VNDEIEVVGPARVNDPERDGLRWLLQAAPWHDYATVARTWNRIRQARNVEALARMKQGDSMAGLPREIEWDISSPWARTSWYYKTSRIR